jgi:hypothetical protein
LKVFVTPIISNADKASGLSEGVVDPGKVNLPFVLHFGQVIKIFSPGLPSIVILFLQFGHIMFFFTIPSKPLELSID